MTQGEPTVLTVTIDAADLATTPAIPVGLSVGGTPTTTCGDTPALSGTALSLAGGSVSPGGSCTLTMPVASTTIGNTVVATGSLISDGAAARPRPYRFR